jgi:hypothetical protein
LSFVTSWEIFVEVKAAFLLRALGFFSSSVVFVLALFGLDEFWEVSFAITTYEYFRCGSDRGE